MSKSEGLNSNQNILSSNDQRTIDSWIVNMNKRGYWDINHRISVAKKSLKLNYDIIGNGFFRIVYDLGNGYVLKVAISNSGIESNKTEYEIYNKCSPKIRNSLCPVIQYGHGWIIMKKLTRKIPEITPNMILRLKNQFLTYGIIPHDLKRDNLALSNRDTITVIDYGNFVMKGELNSFPF
ncbi:hypothetical protein HPT25_20775 [Bacillus sp. BRMEA1]|uniref:hypothetical protein n=1 Tax=Neobacillus endophyticus TaxID=2738405 RepID=UPI00156483AF|nr:hypothetical protein [Neobacillus endophyticus]NRD79775.1 hypothetical protein [Neobacillus endophyticus]